MLLSDHDIQECITSGQIQLDPYDVNSLQPSSIDVTLDNKFIYYREDCRHIDPRKDQAEIMEELVISEGNCFVLPPHGFALGSTVEWLKLSPALASRFEGKSSVGRLGLLPHVAAGFIDAGFQGHITLELHNVTDYPMMLIPGMKVGQLCFFLLSSPVDIPYGSAALNSKYQGQRGPTTSRFHLNYPQ